MGRRKRNCVYEFFSFDDSKKTSTCLICSSVLKGRHGANLLRHFLHIHKQEFQEIVARNKERKLLAVEALNALDASINTRRHVGIKEETFSITDDISLEQENIHDEVEATGAAPAPDPLFEVKINDHSSDSSDSDEEYASHVKSDVMKQSSRARERRHSDVVRKNIAIAEYYEAKTKKVYLEIKKLQLEISLSMRNRSDANVETQIKPENI